MIAAAGASGRHVPGKRLRNWHRATGGGLSLRTFARAISRGAIDPRPAIVPSSVRTAGAWLGGKGVRP